MARLPWEKTSAVQVGSDTSFPNPPVGIASKTFSADGQPTTSLLLLFPVSDAAPAAAAAAAGPSAASGVASRRRLADAVAAAGSARGEVPGSIPVSPLKKRLRSLLDAAEEAGPVGLRRRLIAEGDPSGLFGTALAQLQALVEDQRLVIASTGEADTKIRE